MTDLRLAISPSVLNGSLAAPVSKSSMQRACAAALLHVGESTIQNPGSSNDDLAALDTISKLGAQWEMQGDGSIQVKSAGVAPVGQSINCGESGLGVRMFTPLAALSDQSLTITGNGSLLTRPMHFFDEVFPQLRVQIHSADGHLPLEVKGPLQPTDISIDGSLSSQFLTGLLFAFGKAAAKPVTITVNKLSSKPYIDLTLAVMEHFGYHIENLDHQQYVIHPRKIISDKIVYTVEGDWSGAAFLLVAGAIAGPVTVKGLDAFSTQADKAVLQALMSCGAVVSIEEKQVSIGPARLKPFHFNASDCPDLFPPLAVLAAYCDGKSVIEGVGRLQHKESDRGLTLKDELGKMGVDIQLQDDLMIIDGGKGLKGAETDSRHDHRIAMACAVAALSANGETIINGADAVNKSYPAFFRDLQYLGATVTSLTS